MENNFRTLKRFEEPSDARYLTWSCYQQLELFNNAKIRDSFLEQVLKSKQRLGFKVYAWVVMLEHVHLMVQPFPPELTVTEITEGIKGPFASRTIARWKVLNARVLPRLMNANGQPHFWQQGGGYDRNVFTKRELYEKINYIHANPIRRGYCADVLGWEWSSACWYAGGKARCGLEPDPLPV